MSAGPDLGPPQRLGRKPGPKPRLSRDAVVEAATRVDPLSVSAVAAYLGVAVGSLYRYVDSFDDLVTAARVHLVDATPLPVTDRGWRAFLEEEARTRWTMLREYRALFAVVVGGDPTPVSVSRLDRVVHALVEAGFAVDEAVLVVDSVVDLVHDGARQAFALAEDGAPVDGYSPPVRTAVEAIVADPWAHLERKLALLLDGVEVRAAQNI